MKKTFVIDNMTQRLLEFESITEAKRYAKKRKLKLNKSGLSENSYWFDNAF